MNLFDMIGMTQPAAKPVQAVQKPNGAAPDDGFSKVVSAEEQAGRDAALDGSDLGAGPESRPQFDGATKTAIVSELALNEASTTEVAAVLAGADGDSNDQAADVALAVKFSGVAATRVEGSGAGAVPVPAKSGSVIRAAEMVVASGVVANGTTSGLPADGKVVGNGTTPVATAEPPVLESGNTPLVRIAVARGAAVAWGGEVPSTDPRQNPAGPAGSTDSDAVLNGLDNAEVSRRHSASPAIDGRSQVGVARLVGETPRPDSGANISGVEPKAVALAAQTATEPVVVSASNNAAKIGTTIPAAQIAPDLGAQRVTQQKDTKAEIRAPAASALVNAPDLPKNVTAPPQTDMPVAPLSPTRANKAPAQGLGQASFSASMTPDNAGILSGQGTPQQVSTTGTAANTAPPAAERAVVQQVASSIPPGTAPGRIEFMLDPPELGRIEIAIEVADQSLRATLSAERQVTADLIRRHMDLLNEQFREAGFSDVDLSFADQHGESERSLGEAAALGASAVDVDQPAQSVRPVATQTISTSRMDVRL